VQQYAKRLGNLVLLRVGDNSGLKSAGFIEKKKKKIYAKSAYELTSQVAQADEWMPTATSDRQKTLAAIALKTWPGS
jgi:Protein of unknown function (DUF1524)